MGKYNPTEKEKSDAYGKGYKDAQEGRYNPPKGDLLSDILFPFSSPTTKEESEAKSEYYRDGHSAGSHGPKK